MDEIKRVAVSAVDEILGKKLHVLDDGFVRIIDYMGNDSAIVQAARISYGKGTKKLYEDRGLIRYLVRLCHTSPMEMCEIKLHIRCPMHVFRQWVRHRTANINEYSTRYSDAINSTQRTEPSQWRLQAKNNKQGSGGPLTEWTENYPCPHVLADKVPNDWLSQQESDFHDYAREVYEGRLALGVAREQARKDLPLSTYTEAYWKIDLHNLLHFLSLRMNSQAQEEIRDYATVIGNQIVALWVPLVWEAFKDYRLEAMTLSCLDIEVLQAIASSRHSLGMERAKLFGWLDRKKDGSLKNNRERREFEIKCSRLDLAVPWEAE